MIVQNFRAKPGTAMADHPGRARRVPLDDRGRPARPRRRTSTCRRRRTSATTTSRACSPPASTTGAASRRSPSTTSTRSALARARPAARGDRGARARARAAPHDLPRVSSSRPLARLRAVLTAALRSSDARRPRARRRLVRRRRRPPVPVRAARRARRSTPPTSSATTRSSRLFAARGEELQRVFAAADELRREIIGDESRSSAPQHQLHERLHFKCRFCAFSKGPLSLNLRGPPYLLPIEEIARRVRRGVGPRRHRGVPAGRHPPRLRRRLLRRRREAVKAVAPDIHVHGSPRSRSGRARALGRAARRLPRPAEGRRPRDAAGHRGGDPRRRGPRGHLPRQGQHRGVARGAPDRAPGRAALERHDHVRHVDAPRSSARHLVRDPRAAEGDGRLHRVRAAAVRAHGDADLPARHGPARADVPRGAADARGRADRATRGSTNVQASWVKCGLDGARPRSAGRRQRPRRHADGREHLARGRREPRPGAAAGADGGGDPRRRPIPRQRTTLYGTPGGRPRRRLVRRAAARGAAQPAGRHGRLRRPEKLVRPGLAVA